MDRIKIFRAIYQGYIKWRSELVEQEGLCQDNIDDTVYKILAKEQTKMARIMKGESRLDEDKTAKKQTL